MSQSSAKQLVGGAIGNAIEWYDFAIFGFLAPILSTVFAPASDRLTSMIYIYGLFAIGFISRPLGGLVFGYIGDKFGRSRVLRLTIWGMSIPTVLIGCLPTYAQWGMMSPLCVALLRFLQGCAMGGEFTGSVIFLTESAPKHRQHLFSSFAYVSTTLGILLGSAIVTINQYTFGPAVVTAWAWRVPFLLSGLLAIIAYLLRKQLREPILSSKKNTAATMNPIQQLIRYHLKDFAACLGLNFFNAVGFYTFFLFVVTYLHVMMKHSYTQVLIANVTSFMLLAMMMPVSGWLSDRYGRKRVLLFATTTILFFLFPVFYCYTYGEFWLIFLTMLLVAVLWGLIQGSLPAQFVSVFPPVVRSTGLSVSFNISNALFGGTAPFVATWLFKHTGSYHALVSYLIFSALIFLGVVYNINRQTQ